jgi:hypothetical protein
MEQIKRVQIGNNVVEFGQAESDRLFFKLADEAPTGKETAKQLSAPSGPKWENVGNLFWLGGDLISTAQFALRGAPRKRILYLLTQAYHHISELGLAESEAAKQLALLKSETANLPDSALDRDWRIAFSAKVYKVTGMIDRLLREKQPGYRPNPQN